MYAAQECAQKHAAELGMQTVPSLDVVFTEEQGYVTADVVRFLCFPFVFVSITRGTNACYDKACCSKHTETKHKLSDTAF